MQPSPANTTQRINCKRPGTAYLVFRSVIGSLQLVLVVGVVVAAVDLQIHQASRGGTVALPLRFDDIVSVILPILA